MESNRNLHHQFSEKLIRKEPSKNCIPKGHPQKMAQKDTMVNCIKNYKEVQQYHKGIPLSISRHLSSVKVTNTISVLKSRNKTEKDPDNWSKEAWRWVAIPCSSFLPPPQMAWNNPAQWDGGLFKNKGFMPASKNPHFQHVTD